MHPLGSQGGHLTGILALILIITSIMKASVYLWNIIMMIHMIILYGLGDYKNVVEYNDYTLMICIMFTDHKNIGKESKLMDLPYIV